jgi:hypothetical protein
MIGFENKTAISVFFEELRAPWCAPRDELS